MTFTYALSYGSIVAFTVDPSMFGRAFGCTYSIANLASVVSPLILGWVHDKTMDANYGFTYISLVLFIYSVIAMAFNFALWWEDRKNNNGMLNSNDPYGAKEEASHAHGSFIVA